MPRLSPEDIQEVVAAMLATEQFKWVTTKMEEEQRETEPEGDPLDANFEEPEPEDDDFSDLDDLAGDDLDEPVDEPGADAVPLPDDSVPLQPQPRGKFTMTSANKDSGPTVDKNDQGTPERYAALQQSHNELMKDFAKMTEQVTALRRHNADLNRRGRLEQAAAKFPGLVDVDEECQVALYSLGGDMSDEAFDKHIATVEKYAERAAKASVYIPEGEAPKTEGVPEKYAEAERIKSLALTIHSEELARGKQLTYDECKAKAKERLAQ